MSNDPRDIPAHEMPFVATRWGRRPHWFLDRNTGNIRVRGSTDGAAVIDEAGNPTENVQVGQQYTLSDYMPFFHDSSDSYANNKQFWVSIQHVPSGMPVYFKAFIAAFNETYNTFLVESIPYIALKAQTDLLH